MSDEDDDIDGEGEGADASDDDEDGEDGGKKRKLSGKKLTLFVGAPVLIIGIVVGALFFLGIIGGGGEEDVVVAEDGNGEVELDEHGEPIAEGPIQFYDLPEMLVNLSTDGNKTVFLKIKVSLEVQGEDVAHQLDIVLPRVIDSFQVYMRTLWLEVLS